MYTWNNLADRYWRVEVLFLRKGCKSEYRPHVSRHLDWFLCELLHCSLFLFTLFFNTIAGKAHSFEFDSVFDENSEQCMNSVLIIKFTIILFKKSIWTCNGWPLP